MRVVYSDESGTGSIAEEPITVVTALMLNLDSQWEPVHQDLEALRPSPTFEFKGGRLFRELRNGRRRERADAILRGILSHSGAFMTSASFMLRLIALDMNAVR
jgi:hypothetical protein